MRHLLMISLQIVALAGGLVLFYLAAFMYPKGKVRVGNKLEDWWAGLRRSSDFSVSPATVFVRTIAFYAELHLSWLPNVSIIEGTEFPILLSLESCLFMCFVFVVPVMTATHWTNPLILFRIAANNYLRWVLPLAVLSPPFALFFLRLFSKAFLSWTNDGISRIRRIFQEHSNEPAKAQGFRVPRPELKFHVGLKGLVAAGKKLIRIGWLLYAYFQLAIFYIFSPLFCVACVGWLGLLAFLALRMLGGTKHHISWMAIGATLLLSHGTAFLFYRVMLRVLERCRRDWSLKESIVAILGVCASATFLFCAPLFFVNDGWTIGIPTPQQFDSANARSGIARCFAYSNAGNLLPSYGVVLVALLLLAHRYAWPYLRRVVLYLREADVPLSPKGLYVCGAILIISSSGWVPTIIQQFMTNPQVMEDMENFVKKFAP